MHLWHDEKGGVLPLFLLSLSCMILLLALVINAGNLFRFRTLTHAVADMAALAGAQELDLELLARGERALIPEAASRQARQVAWAAMAANLPPGITSFRVDVTVINASSTEPGIHPWTYRRLFDPTVSVRVNVSVPLYLAGPTHRSVWTGARADASVLPRRRP